MTLDEMKATMGGGVKEVVDLVHGDARDLALQLIAMHLMMVTCIVGHRLAGKQPPSPDDSIAPARLDAVERMFAQADVANPMLSMLSIIYVHSASEPVIRQVALSSRHRGLAC